jgi:hypothetical protein
MVVNGLAKEIHSLKLYFKSLNGFQRFFFPNPLKRALSNDASSLHIIETALQKTWFFHRWIFPGLNTFLKSNPIQKICVLFQGKSKTDKIQVKKNSTYLWSMHESEQILSIVLKVQQTDPLHKSMQLYLDQLHNHANQAAIQGALIRLNHHDYFSSIEAHERFLTLLSSADPEAFAQAIIAPPPPPIIVPIIKPPILHAPTIHIDIPPLRQDPIQPRPFNTYTPEPLPLPDLNDWRRRRFFQYPHQEAAPPLSSPISPQPTISRERTLNDMINELFDTDAHLLDENDVEQIVEHAHPGALQSAIGTLKHRNLLNKSNFHRILRSQNAFDTVNHILTDDSRLRDLAGYSESSMRPLSAAEESRIRTAEAHYQTHIQATGGLDECFEQLKVNLTQRYENAPAQLELTNGSTIPLPSSWTEFEALALLPQEREHALTAYYQHKTHTALRYISKPNCWMSEDSIHTMTDYSTSVVTRYSNFQNNQALISLAWMAASDDASPPTNGYTHETRIDYFITELAGLGRAHNWDRYRNKLQNGQTIPLLDAQGAPLYEINEDGSFVTDYHGNRVPKVVLEQYDDLEGDKSSCSRGERSRIYSSVQGHVLFTGPTLETIQTELTDYIKQHFIQHIRQLSPSQRKILKDAWNELIETGAIHGLEQQNDGSEIANPIACAARNEALTELNVTPFQKSAFVETLRQKYNSFDDSPEFLDLLNNRLKITNIHPYHASSFGGEPIHLSSLLERSNSELSLQLPHSILFRNDRNPAVRVPLTPFTPDTIEIIGSYDLNLG